MGTGLSLGYGKSKAALELEPRGVSDRARYAGHRFSLRWCKELRNRREGRGEGIAQRCKGRVWVSFQAAKGI